MSEYHVPWVPNARPILHRMIQPRIAIYGNCSAYHLCHHLPSDCPLTTHPLQYLLQHLDAVNCPASVYCISTEENGARKRWRRSGITVWRFESRKVSQRKFSLKLMTI